MGGSDRPITVVARKSGCYKYSVGACTPGTIYGMCGNSDPRTHCHKRQQIDTAWQSQRPLGTPPLIAKKLAPEKPQNRASGVLAPSIVIRPPVSSDNYIL
jgi:hypothetical protein